MPPFAQSLSQVQISILEILHMFLRLKFSPSLILTKIEHFLKVSMRSLLVLMLVVVISSAPGCRKGEKPPPVPPVAESNVRDRAPAPAGEQTVPESPAQAQALTFHSVLTKDMNRPIPVDIFSKNDRIYLVTTWTGLQGPHEIKVLWIRPDKTVQETVRLKENISSKIPSYNSWAYLSFTKGLLNISHLEGKFIGSWKAQLFLDEKLLKEYDFSVY
jgi:hypothetical protein